MKLLHIGIMSGDNGFTKALRSVCDQYAEVPTGHPRMNDEVCRISEEFKPDLVFIQIQATGLNPHTLKLLRDNGAYIINWSGDVRAPLPAVYIEMAKYCDITCFSNMVDVEYMRKFGLKSDFLQIGYDPEIYTPIGYKADVPEIVFMGNNCGGFPLSQYRRDMVAFLQSEYGNRFGVYGSGWEPCAGNYMGDQFGEASVYRGAKIAINLSHFDYERYSSDRLLRALGCGVFVLSHNFKGIYEDFSETEVGTWNDFQSLRLNIDFHLRNEAIRIDKAGRGNKKAFSTYTFRHMAENIKSLYDGR